MTNLEIITKQFEQGKGVTLKVAPNTIHNARDLVRLAQRRTGVDVSSTLIGDKLIVEIVGGN